MVTDDHTGIANYFKAHLKHIYECFSFTQEGSEKVDNWALNGKTFGTTTDMGNKDRS